MNVTLFPPTVKILSLAALALLLQACAHAPTRAVSGTPAAHADAPRPANIFDEYLRADFAPADGFDFPFGDGNGGGTYTDLSNGRRYSGWHITTRFAETDSLGTQPGEDWQGAGGGDTSSGQPVYAVAGGRVIFAGDCGRPFGNVLLLEHFFYENHERLRIRSLYAHLGEIKVRAGESVRRRQLIATIARDPEKLSGARLHLELRLDETLPPDYWPAADGKDTAWVREHYAEPSAFIASHRSTFVPQNEHALVLVDQESYRARLYLGGKLAGEYDVSLGQGEGPKRVEGDNKTPKGMYFVVDKRRGHFPGDYGAYFGGHWIKFNYPNRYDAARARAEGLITPAQESKIADAWAKRAPTDETTRLGGGIGFHGWAREWPNEGSRHLSWGCVVLHLSDISNFYDQLPAGAMVVIF